MADQSNNTLNPVSVSVDYTLPDQERQNFRFEGSEPARIGLPLGVVPTKPKAGDYSYSGMHDQGPLPPPREGGPMAQLISCVQQAKQANDAYLSDIIEQEKCERSKKRAKAEVTQS